MARYPFCPKDEPYWLGEVLAHETRIVWLLDPSRFAYVRQAAIVTGHRAGCRQTISAEPVFSSAIARCVQATKVCTGGASFICETPIATSTRWGRIAMALRPRRWTR